MTPALEQLEPPLSAWLTVHCPHRPCTWTRDYGFSLQGLNLANTALLDHISRRHPRAWARHCHLLNAPTSPQHDPYLTP